MNNNELPIRDNFHNLDDEDVALLNSIIMGETVPVLALPTKMNYMKNQIKTIMLVNNRLVFPFSFHETTKEIKTALGLDDNTKGITRKKTSRSWVSKYFRKDIAHRVNICCLCE